MKQRTEVKPERRHLETCYVCSHKITGEPVRIGASAKHPAGLYRHIRCEPGSARWMDSETGKQSAVRSYFPEQEGTP